jgi:hypothetical protein
MRWVACVAAPILLANVGNQILNDAGTDEGRLQNAC